MGNYALFQEYYLPYEGWQGFGWESFVDTFDTKEEAKTYYNRVYKSELFNHSYYQIVDLLSKRIVEES